MDRPLWSHGQSPLRFAIPPFLVQISLPSGPPDGVTVDGLRSPRTFTISATHPAFVSTVEVEVDDAGNAQPVLVQIAARPGQPLAQHIALGGLPLETLVVEGLKNVIAWQGIAMDDDELAALNAVIDRPLSEAWRRARSEMELENVERVARTAVRQRVDDERLREVAEAYNNRTTRWHGSRVVTVGKWWEGLGVGQRQADRLKAQAQERGLIQGAHDAES